MSSYRLIGVRGRASVLVGSAGAAMSILGASSAVAGPASTDYFWANATSGAWGNLNNWTPAGVPDVAGETATINATGAAYTVSLDFDPTISGFKLDSTDATLQINGHTLTVNGPDSLVAGTARMINSAWAGSGTLANQANLWVEGNSAINCAISNTGLLWVRGTSANNSDLSIGAFTNDGTLRLESVDAATTSYLDINGAGLFTNAGTFEVNVGSGGARRLNGSLSNSGTVSINQDFSMSAGSSAITNTGTFTVAAGKTMTFNAGS